MAAVGSQHEEREDQEVAHADVLDVRAEAEAHRRIEGRADETIGEPGARDEARAPGLRS